ncbi:MAG: stage V sporulation protein AD [Erysipelotrichaceae bacterium]|nr:stage V sporulation protein AD [Erysipelotrichaceae bacterium]
MNKIRMFHQVYLQDSTCVVGPLEYAGPLQKGYDDFFDDFYCDCKNFEHAEVALLQKAYAILLNKLQVDTPYFAFACGGDLQNQLGASHYFARSLHIPFIGVYAACANSTLALHQAATYLSDCQNQHALVFTSSHYGSAEKQFRFPNEYGIQKKETVTMTVTGAGCIALTNKPQPVQITQGILGEIVDAFLKDANDMGSAMVMAAYTTIQQFLHESTISYAEIDHIFTGDLSSKGLSILKELLQKEYPDIDQKLSDCGLLIYDRKKQPVFAGGSGCGCSMCTLIADLLPKLHQKVYRKILLVATGALLNPIMIQQKETIPCIAHGILLENTQ